MDALNILFVVYFTMHVPTTVLIDAQAILPQRYFPDFAKDLVKNVLVKQMGDPQFDGTVDNWFAAMVWIECLVQFPFFFVAIYGILKCTLAKLRNR